MTKSAFMPAAVMALTAWSSTPQSKAVGPSYWTEDQSASSRTHRKPMLCMLARAADCCAAVSPTSEGTLMPNPGPGAAPAVVVVVVEVVVEVDVVVVVEGDAFRRMWLLVVASVVLVVAGSVGLLVESVVLVVAGSVGLLVESVVLVLVGSVVLLVSGPRRP